MGASEDRIGACGGGIGRSELVKVESELVERSYVNALLTTGSVAAGGISDDRDTSEEPEEDPFTKKMKYKRRIVMSDNEDED
ncbi:hypothetical protein B9Z55_011184 [Caenorhabditis nigoni]|uniref:Uncharacterized protein n=1 Tax=Caenorhabditis nigoni TaxID=1611254 RepID=A0A2G5UJ17_9PELO|nr:hypothetical protein B9Z55_011184 [Caenorhabditis nigoni]